MAFGIQRISACRNLEARHVSALRRRFILTRFLRHHLIGSVRHPPNAQSEKQPKKPNREFTMPDNSRFASLHLTRTAMGDREADDLRPALGIAIGVFLSIPFWAIIIAVSLAFA
jgi:hypothetical protein